MYFVSLQIYSQILVEQLLISCLNLNILKAPLEGQNFSRMAKHKYQGYKAV